jgi:hypothetical protein
MLSFLIYSFGILEGFEEDSFLMKKPTFRSGFWSFMPRPTSLMVTKMSSGLIFTFTSFSSFFFSSSVDNFSSFVGIFCCLWVYFLRRIASQILQIFN